MTLQPMKSENPTKSSNASSHILTPILTLQHLKWQITLTSKQPAHITHKNPNSNRIFIKYTSTTSRAFYKNFNIYIKPAHIFAVSLKSISHSIYYPNDYILNLLNFANINRSRHVDCQRANVFTAIAKSDPH